jgi:hypothetical protein
VDLHYTSLWNSMPRTVPMPSGGLYLQLKQSDTEAKFFITKISQLHVKTSFLDVLYIVKRDLQDIYKE